MKAIIQFPKGSLSLKERKSLIAAGYVPLETDAEIKVMIPASLASADDLALAAMKALNDCGYPTVKGEFLENLYVAITARKGSK